MTLQTHICRWLLAIFVMAIIFAFSSTPSNELPNFGLIDFLVKKTSHALGYAILSLCFLRAIRINEKVRWYWLAFFLSVLYSATDEFHQGFVPGRHPSPMDVGIDSFGAAFALTFMCLYPNAKKGLVTLFHPFWPCNRHTKL